MCSATVSRYTIFHSRIDLEQSCCKQCTSTNTPSLSSEHPQQSDTYVTFSHNVFEESTYLPHDSAVLRLMAERQNFAKDINF